MADFVDIAYLTNAFGISLAKMQVLMQNVVLQKPVLDALGLRVTADATTAVNPITRTIRLAFGPSAAVDAVPVVRSDGTIFGITPGSRSDDFIRPPFVRLLPLVMTPAILRAFLRVNNFTVVAGGAAYATVPNVAFMGGLPPAGRTFRGCVRTIFLKDSGLGYPVGTTVSIDGGSLQNNSPAIQAKASLTLDAFGRITSVTLTNMGAAYTQVPKVVFHSLGGVEPRRAAKAFVAMAEGSPAQGIATVVANAVTGIALSSQGGGYVGVPDILITGGGGAGAILTARMELERVDILFEGAGYPAVGTSVVFTPYFKQQFSDGAQQGPPFRHIFQSQFVTSVVTPIISAAPVLI